MGNEKIQYKSKVCDTCDDVTIHALVDLMIKGEMKQVWQCEVCGSYEE